MNGKLIKRLKTVKMKKAYLMIIAVILAGILFSTPILAGEITELEEQREATQEEVNQLQEELNTLVTELDTTETQLISMGEQIIQRERELEKAEEDRQRQYDDMMLRIVYIYEVGTVSVLERILSAGSIAEILVQAEMVQAFHNHDRAMLEKFIETVEHIDDLKVSLEEDFANLEYKQETFKVQVENVRTLIETRSADLDNIDELITEAIRIAAELAEAEAQAAAEAEAARELEDENYYNEIAEIPPDSEEDVPPTPPAEDPPYEPPSNGDAPPFVPPGGDATAAQVIVAAAHSAIGVPYVWGGQTMAGFDCSGLTMWAHAQAGISIPRTSITQRNAGRPVPMGEQQPGDIAWTFGHVGLYIGGGMMIEAQQTGTNVMISPVRVDVFVRFW